MQERSTVELAGSSRVHIALEARDLEASLRFYRTLFEREPSKLRPDYAKFEPQSPALNLSLNQIPPEAGRPARVGDQHFGIQVQSSADVERTVARLAAAGLRTHVEKDTACCYAVQDKVWVEDPDGNAWEVFVVLGDSDQKSSSGAEEPCCVPSPFAGSAGCSCC